VAGGATLARAMARFSIGRSLRLALVGLTLTLALVAALGVSSLYGSRQRYEDTLARSAALATAAANLATAGIAEEEVLRDARGPGAAAARLAVARDYRSAASEASLLARSDPLSEAIITVQVAAESRARALVAAGNFAAAGAADGPLARARTLAATLQARQQTRQDQARAKARSDSRRAIILVLVAGLLTVGGALALVALLVGAMRSPQIDAERRQLEVTIESLGDGLVVTGPDSSTIAAVNPRANELLPELMVGGHVDQAGSPLPPLERALGTETVVQHLDRTLAVTAAKLGGDAGGVVWTVRDTSERARIERAKSEFVATASHELRSPLTSIKGFIELLERSPEAMTDRQREFVDIILRSTDRLVELVNDLLDVARLEADRVELNRRPIDVGEAVREVAELMGPRIAEKHQRLGVYVAGALPPAYADAGRVRQILANLLTNAHLYTEDGGRLHIGVEADRAWIQIVVEDSGRGMTREETERVFDRFYRGRDGGHANPGTGLGLAIVKSLVDLHHGQIEIDSEPGRGTSFRVLLPCALPGPESTRSIDAIRGRRVLVIDDQPEIAELIAGQLAPLEVEATIAHSGEEALEKLHAGRFDAITLDILMPDMDGFEVLRRIRDDPELRITPIVFVSVFSGRQELAGEWVVSKPIDADELRDALAAAVSTGRSRVLVVGREALQETLEPALDDLGIEHEWQTSGPAAARVCGERRFEVALVDVGVRSPQAVLQALDLRGRRIRRAVILFSDGATPVPPGVERLGMEVIPVEHAAAALLAALRVGTEG
jgi:signal transduction histidine kinase/DNA-binding NarL/FixJ family response regulator